MLNKPRVPAHRLCTTIAVAFLASGPVTAFTPAEEYGHIGITSSAALQITYAATGGDQLRFRWSAIEEMRVADAGVDGWPSGEFSDPTAHCDNETLSLCSARIMRLKGEAIEALRNPATRDGQQARVKIGRALHTLQDFYSHSNWVSSPGPSHASFNPQLGRNILQGLQLSQQTCMADSDQSVLTASGLTNVTTGYFSTSLFDQTPHGKCIHGYPGGITGTGIHKDFPGRPFFIPARAEAVEATKDFLNQIIDAIKSDEGAVRALMGTHTGIGFVIDDTGSMGRYINGVYSSVYVLGQEAMADPNNAPERFLLQTFNDPTIGTPQNFVSFPSLLGGVGAIHPYDGGDCPELAMTGVWSALGAARGGSKLFVYTDASAKDSDLRGSVAALAASRNVTVNYFVSGSCSPIDPGYYEIASRTGGVVILAYNTELATPMLRAAIDPQSRLVFSAADTLAGDQRRYRINVDSAASKLTIAVGTDNIRGIKLTDPDGIDVAHNVATTQLLDFYSGAMLSVATPKPGEWTLEFTGTGKGFANAYVSSPISIASLDPVEESGRLAHTGLFPVNGSPVLGSSGQLQLTMDGASADQLEIRQLNGELVSMHPFTPAETEDLGERVHKYLTPITLDETPVRFFVRGKDANGVTFLRAYPTSYSAQPIRVSVERADFRFEPGHSRTVNYIVENHGFGGDFKFTAHSPENVIAPAFGSPTVYIAAGATATIGVPVSIPADSKLEFVSLQATAQDVGNARRMNSSVMQFSVASRDSDADGIVDDLDQCPASVLETTVHVDACDSGVANHLFSEGCTISDEIGTLRAAATNHGDFVSATSHYTHDLIDLGIIEKKQAGSIVSCAAKSTMP